LRHRDHTHLRDFDKQVTAREQFEIVLTLQGLTLEASPYKQDATSAALLQKVEAIRQSPVSSLSSTLGSVSPSTSASDD
jgi:hypothetical protein